MSILNLLYIFLFIIVLISKEFIYISDEFLVIFAFLIIVTLFFSKLSNVLSTTLDEYSQKISNSAKELVVLQQKILVESKEYQLDLLTLQQRIQYILSYILEQTSDISDVCDDKYITLVESYINNKLISLLLLDIEYYEKAYLEIFAKDIDILISDKFNLQMLDSETVNQQNIFFPFVDTN